MRKTWFFLWLIATVGVTYVANAAVKLVDLQVFPGGSRIEVLALPEKETQKIFEMGPLNSNFKEKSDNKEVDAKENLEESLISTTTFQQGSEISFPPAKNIEENSSETFFEPNKETQDETPSSLETETVDESPETAIATDAISTDIATITVPIDEVENPIVENGSEVLETLAPATTIDAAISVSEEEVDSIKAIELETFELRVGTESVKQLVTGGSAPYKWFLVEGEIPKGLNIDEEGFLVGTPVKSGFFQFSIEFIDSSENTIFQTISINLNEYRVITSRGGTVTVLISGDSVSFFSGLQSDSFFSPEIIRNGPLVLEVQFLPIVGDETSWIRCEVNEGVTCSSD